MGSMECVVCHPCKLFWYQVKGKNIEGVLHPPCQNPVRAAKRPPKEYQEYKAFHQQKAA